MHEADRHSLRKPSPTGSTGRARFALGRLLAVFGVLLAAAGVFLVPTASAQFSQPVALQNIEAPVENNSCPDATSASWHFVVTPNNGAYVINEITLNLDGTTVVFAGAQIVANGSQKDNVFVRVPDGYTIASIGKDGSFAQVAPETGSPKFVLSHLCTGSTTPTTTTTTSIADQNTTTTTVTDQNTTTTVVDEEDRCPPGTYQSLVEYFDPPASVVVVPSFPITYLNVFTGTDHILVGDGGPIGGTTIDIVAATGSTAVHIHYCKFIPGSTTTVPGTTTTTTVPGTTTTTTFPGSTTTVPATTTTTTTVPATTTTVAATTTTVAATTTTIPTTTTTTTTVPATTTTVAATTTTVAATTTTVPATTTTAPATTTTVAATTTIPATTTTVAATTTSTTVADTATTTTLVDQAGPTTTTTAPATTTTLSKVGQGGPTTTAAGVAAATTTVNPTTVQLPRTGSDASSSLLVMGALLVMLGGVLMLTTRRTQIA